MNRRHDDSVKLAGHHHRHHNGGLKIPWLDWTDAQTSWRSNAKYVTPAANLAACFFSAKSRNKDPCRESLFKQSEISFEYSRIQKSCALNSRLQHTARITAISKPKTRTAGRLQFVLWNLPSLWLPGNCCPLVWLPGNCCLYSATLFQIRKCFDILLTTGRRHRPINSGFV